MTFDLQNLIHSTVSPSGWLCQVWRNFLKKSHTWSHSDFDLQMTWSLNKSGQQIWGTSLMAFPWYCYYLNVKYQISLAMTCRTGKLSRTRKKNHCCFLVVELTLTPTLGCGGLHSHMAWPHACHCACLLILSDTHYQLTITKGHRKQHELLLLCPS